MPREARRRDRLVGLFALGVVVFNPPVLWLFAGGTVFGWPRLFVFLFCAWAALTTLIALTVEGRAGQNGSIAANVDRVTPRVVSLTIPQPPASGPQEISLVIRESAGVTKLFQDAVEGKSIPEVDITLDRLGNPTTDTITLTHAIIASFQVLDTGDIPNVQISLVAETETIQQS